MLPNKRFLNPLLLIILTGVLSACFSTGTTVEGMTIAESDLPPANANSELVKNVFIDKIEAGPDESSKWSAEVSVGKFREALSSSLQQASLLSASKSAPFRLNVELRSLEQPKIEFETTVNAIVRYTLLRSSDHAVVLDKTISTSHRVTSKEAYEWIRRLQYVNEGAIVKNIRQLVQALYTDALTT